MVCDSLPVVVTISCMGYKTYTDTLTNSTKSLLKLTPDVFSLDEVVVTGQFTPRKSDNSIYDVKVLSSQDISRRAADNLGSLLSFEPDISLRQEGVLGRTLSLRGLGGEHVKILYNGIPVIGRQNGIIDLDQLALSNVDHIEIIEGPLSVIYGSNALGGAINIITKQNVPDKLYFNAGSLYESAGTYNFGFNSYYEVKNNQFGLHLARNFFAGYNPDRADRYKIWRPRLQYLPGFTYSYHSTGLNAGLTVDYLHEELRDKDSLSADNLYESADDTYYFTKRLNTGLHLDYRVSKKSRVLVETGFSAYDKIKNSYHINLVTLDKYLINDTSLQDTTRFRMAQQRGSFVFRPGKTELTGGYDFSYEYGYGKRLGGNRTISDYAFFACAIIPVLAQLQFQPGIRYGYNSRYKPPLIYSMNLKYDPGAFRLRASYGKGFRIPSLKELFMEFIDQNHHVYGNSELKAETAHNLSFSATWIRSHDRHNLRLKLDLFQNRIFNKIDFLLQFDALGNLRSAKYFNLPQDNYTTRGFTFSSQYKLVPSLVLGAGLNSTGLSALTLPGTYRYSNDITASAAYQFVHLPAELNVYYKYTDRRYFYTLNTTGTTGSDNIREDYIDGYHNLDITISAYLLGRSMQLTGGIRNIFDNIMVFSTGSGTIHAGNPGDFPVGMGRMFFVKLNYIFKIKGR